MIVRRATAADTAVVAGIARRAYARYIPRVGRPPGPVTQDYAGPIAAGEITVIETGGEVAGYVELGVEREPAGPVVWVRNLAVAPEHQGRGLASVFWDVALAEAEAAGARTLRLYTHVTMTENIAAYAAVGFREIGRRADGGFERVFMEADADTLRRTRAARRGGG